MHLHPARWFAILTVGVAPAFAQVSPNAPGDPVRIVVTDGLAKEAVIQIGDPTPTDAWLSHEESIDGLSLPGFGLRMEPGMPVVPMRRILLDAPADGNVTLEVACEDERVLTIGPRKRMPGDAADASPPYATLEYVGWLRDRSVACVKLQPVKMNAESGVAHIARRLRVRITSGAHGGSVTPTVPTLPPITIPGPKPYQPHVIGSPPQGGAPRLLRAGTPALWERKIRVDQAGLYRITWSDLRKTGVDPSKVDPRRIVMFHHGLPIPIHVEGEADGSFDPGDRVVFYAALETGPYARTTSFVLEEVAQGAATFFPRWATAPAAPLPATPSINSFRWTSRAEQNLAYWQLLPNASTFDHWLWYKLLGPTTTDFAIQAPHPYVPGTAPVIRVEMHGYTDTPQNPDHHTEIQLNTRPASNVTWNGITQFTQSGSVGPAFLLAGTNGIRLKQIADTGAIVDGIYVNGVELDYDRATIADADELTIKLPAGATVNATVTALSSLNAYVLDIRNPEAPVLLTGVAAAQAGAAFSATFSLGGSGGAKVLAAGPNALRTPLSIGKFAREIVSPPAGADWVVIAPHALHASLAPLVAHRTAQGLRVATFDIESIYDSFLDGVESPEAIVEFGKWAFAQWPAPKPQHLLLVGGSTIDFLGSIAPTPGSKLPTMLHSTLTSGEIPTDHAFACVVGNDPLPDWNVGRIPCGAPTDVANVVAKILARETAPPTGAWRREVLHVSDKGGAFTTTLDLLASGHVPAAYTVTTVYADNYASAAATKAALLPKLSGGQIAATYLGHGALQNWNTYFSNTDVAGLANGHRAPLFTALNCLNAYFAEPYGTTCLASEMLRNPNKGAVAAFAAIGLGFLSQLTPIASREYDRLFAGESIGSVTTGSKLDAYLNDGVIEDFLWDLELFGDPACHLLVP